MSYYRRAKTSGSYFFTVVSYRRQNILCDIEIRHALRQSIIKTRYKYPFTIDAWVLLPNHLHCIWTLPEGDANFSVRWALIKREVSPNTNKINGCLHQRKNIVNQLYGKDAFGNIRLEIRMILTII